MAFCFDCYACTCGEMSVKDRLDASEIVFAGKVVSRKKALFNGEDSVRVDFKVERFWKGKYKSPIFVFTGPTEDLWGEEYLDLCAMRFKIDERYLVFVNSKNNPKVDICSGTVPFPEAKELINQLNKKRSNKKWLSGRS